jgi:hypothetical protein
VALGPDVAVVAVALLPLLPQAVSGIAVSKSAEMQASFLFIKSPNIALNDDRTFEVIP